MSRLTLFLVWCLFIAAGPVAAHHSMAMFEEDPAKRVTLKGAVVQWVWANPHCLLQIDVTDDAGKTTRWVVETSNPLDMTNRGWSRNSLKAGDPVAATVRPIKTGKPLGIIVQVQLADGRILSTTNAPTAPSRP